MKKNITYRYVLPIMVMFCVLGSTIAHAAETRLKVGIYHNPPIVFIDEKDTPQGVYVDTLNAIAKQEKWALDYVFVQWSELLDKVKTGEIDLATAIAYSPERDTWLDFNQEVFAERWGVVYAPTGAPISAMADLTGKRVALVRQDIHAGYFKQAAESMGLEFTQVEMMGYEEVFQANKNHNADACVVSSGYGSSNADSYGLEATPLTFKPTRLVVAFPKGKHRDIADTIDACLKKWKNEPDSVYKASYRRWLGKSRGQGGQLALTSEQRTWLANHDTVRVAFDGYFPPYSYLTDDSRVEGLAVDVLRHLTDRLGIRLEIHPSFVWKDLFAAAVQREVDMVATMVQRPEREQWFAFTRPYIYKSLAIMTRDDDESIRQREDIAGKRVALVRGYQYVKKIIKDFPTLKPYYVDTMLDGLNSVATGNADAAVTFFGAGRYLKTKYGITNLKFAAAYDRSSSLECIAVRKDWPELAAILDKALSAIDQTEMHALQLKWNADEALVTHFKDSRRSRQVMTWLIALAVLAGLALLAFASVTAWNSALREQVDAKTHALESELAESSRMAVELKANEERFRTLVDQSPLGISLIGKDGRYKYINPQFQNLFGYTIEEIPTGSDWIQKAYPDKKYRDMVLKAWIEDQKHTAIGQASSRVFTVTCKYGSNKEIHFRCVKMDNSDEFVLYDDITDQKRSEEEIRKLSEVVEQSPMYIAITDPNGLIEYVNPAFLKITGYCPKEVLGKNPRILQSGETPTTTYVDLWETILSGSVWKGEFINKKKDGTLFWESATISPATDNDGKIKHFIAIKEDITERKQIEESLRKSEEKMKSIFRAAPVGIGLVSNRVLLDVNDRFCEMTGYFKHELIGKNARILYPTEQDYEYIGREKYRQIKKHGTGTVETRFKRKNGEIINVLMSSTPIDSANLSAGVTFTALDITSRIRAEKEKSRLEEQYHQAQKVESIGRLAGGVAHDLNNLLTPILGYSEMLREDSGLKDMHWEFVDQIMRAGRRARDLVRQLLAFSRKQTLEYKPVDMNQAVTGFEKLLRRTIREDIEVKIITSPDIRIVMADIAQIEQVIMNLAVNAQDAMPEGGCLTIETATVDLDNNYTAPYMDVKPGAYIMLAISDTGSGMDDETRENMFEPFFSTKGEQGTGLGLATVYGIVKQHEGNIWVYSEPGKGTTFKIYLPVSEQALVEEKVSIKRTNELRGSETILLVEDDEQVRALAHVILEQNGYTVLESESGPDALKSLVSHDSLVHLLLTDVVLPGMNGKELFARVSERFPNIKVLYMSGYTGEVIAHRGVLDQGIAFIQKPFNVQDLITKVREVLEQD